MKTIYWLPAIGSFAVVIAIHTIPTHRWTFDLDPLTTRAASLSLRDEELDRERLERDGEDMQQWLVFIDYVATQLAAGESNLSEAADEVLPMALNKPKWASSVRFDYTAKFLINEESSDRIMIARYLITKIEDMQKMAEKRGDGLRAALLFARIEALYAEFQLLRD